MLSKKSPWNLIAAFICYLSCASLLLAQDKGPSTPDLSDVLRELSSIRVELNEVRDLLRVQRASLPVGASRVPNLPQSLSQTITLPFVPEESIGDKNADFILVQFSDPQCPFCIHFSKNTLPVFKEKYVATGKIRLMNVEFPLESHPQAAKLSLASVCAAEQNRYWEMRDLLIDSKASSADEAIKQSAKTLGLDLTALEICFTSPAKLKIMTDRAEQARNAGVYSTPTFLIGRVKDGMIAGVTVIGDLPASDFNAKIDAAMNDLRKGHDDTKVAAVRIEK